MSERAEDVEKKKNWPGRCFFCRLKWKNKQKGVSSREEQKDGQGEMTFLLTLEQKGGRGRSS